MMTNTAIVGIAGVIVSVSFLMISTTPGEISALTHLGMSASLSMLAAIIYRWPPAFFATPLIILCCGGAAMTLAFAAFKTI
jgi:hypothetical protein